MPREMTPRKFLCNFLNNMKSICSPPEIFKQISLTDWHAVNYKIGAKSVAIIYP